MENKDLIELLANYEHDRWSRWQKYLFSKCIKNDDGSLTIPKEYVNRWNRQINTDYTDLPIEEQLSDKKEAIKIIEIVEGNDFNE